jgi:hypothetical protein
MAYSDAYHKRRVAYIMDVYSREKHYDIPDSFIVARVFPKYGIFISYSQFMNYKGNRSRPLAAVPNNVLTLF